MSHLSGKISLPSQGIPIWVSRQDERGGQFIHPDNDVVGTVIAEAYYNSPEKREVWIASLVRYTKTYKRDTGKGFQSGVILEYKIQSNLIHPNPVWLREGLREVYFHNEKAGLSILERYSIEAVLKILGAKSISDGDRLWVEKSKAYEDASKKEREREDDLWVEKIKSGLGFYSWVLFAGIFLGAFLYLLYRVYYLAGLYQIGFIF